MGYHLHTLHCSPTDSSQPWVSSILWPVTGTHSLQGHSLGSKWAPRPLPCPRLPITTPLLRAVKSHRSSNLDRVMSWAACCMGSMRAGEFTVKSSHNVDHESSLSLQDRLCHSIVRVHLVHSLPSGCNPSILYYLPDGRRFLLHPQGWVIPDKGQAGHCTAVCSLTGGGRCFSLPGP